MELRIRVAPPRAGEGTGVVSVAPEPGGERSPGERGRRLDDGTVCQGYMGPLHRRAVLGVRLIDSERRADDFDVFEDMLYTAAMHAGWVAVPGQPPSTSLTSRFWFASRDGRPLVAEEAPNTWLPIAGRPRRILSESEIAAVALELAADRGDPHPRLIQHVTCTRAEANRVGAGAGVPGERASWLIAIQGRFVTPARRPEARRRGGDGAGREYTVITLVIDAETGAPTDSGSGNEYPDLAAAGPVITDYSAEEPAAG